MKYAVLLMVLVCSACAASSDQEVAAGDSPFEEFFESGGGREAALQAWQLQVQEDVAVCMKEEGFEFTPSLPASARSNSEDSDLEPLEYAKEYGYGISTKSDSLLNDLSADPNTAYLLTLSEADQAVYREKLIGEELANYDPNSGPIDVPLSEQGCTGTAVEQHGGNAITVDLQEALADFEQRMEDDVMRLPEVEEATNKWQSCMLEDGFDYPGGKEILTELTSEFGAIMAPFSAGLASLDKEQLDQIAESPETANEFLPDFEWSRLVALQEKEKLIAVADQECYSEHVESILLPHRHQLEQEILTEYEPEMRAAQEFLSVE